MDRWDNQDLAEAARRSGSKAPISRAKPPATNVASRPLQGVARLPAGNRPGAGKNTAEAKVRFSPIRLGPSTWVMSRISACSAVERANAQLLVPRSIPRQRFFAMTFALEG